MQYRYSKLYYIILIISALSLVSCSKAEPYEMPGEEIVFNAAPETKAYELTTANIVDMGVYATLDRDGNSFSTSSALINFMNNVEVGRQSGGWHANPRHYWPYDPTMKLSFFAYAPYRAEGLEVSAPADKDWTGSKTLEIGYAPNSNPFSQIDFCVARAVTDRTNAKDADGNIPPVTLNFRHTLCWITFAANYIGDLPDNCILHIDELTLKNVVRQNTLVYNANQEGEYFYWETIPADAPRRASYTLSTRSTTLGQAPIPMKTSENSAFQEISTADGYLYLLPQPVNAAAQGDTQPKSMIEVMFSFVKDDAQKTVIAQFYTTMELPQGNWEIAQKIKYNFTLDVSSASLIFFEPSIEDWKPSNNNHPDTEIR